MSAPEQPSKRSRDRLARITPGTSCPGGHPSRHHAAGDRGSIATHPATRYKEKLHAPHSRACLPGERRHPRPDDRTGCFDLPTPDVATLQPETALDTLEATTQDIGMTILRRLLHVQWDAMDAALVAQHCAQMAPAVVQHDGHETVTVASRFGLLHLARQVCVDPQTQSHTMPGNAVLPPHGGIIITRGLQEWGCLLPQELSFAAVARLLGWQTQEEKVLSATTLRTLVRTHGQIIRQAEQREATVLLQRDDRETLRPHLLPLTAPRRRAGWPKELSTAVDLALAAGADRPPQGIRQADWDRVLDARRQEANLTLEELRHLGPALEPAQVLLTIDAVLTRTPQAHQFGEIRTARLMTAEGTRCLSGTGEAFLQTLRVLTLLSVGPGCSLLLLADGARWIRAFFHSMAASVTPTTMIVDWWHLAPEMRRVGQPDLSWPSGQRPLPPAGAAPAVARRRGRRLCLCGGLSAPGQEQREAGGAARLSARPTGVLAQLSSALHDAPVHRQWAHGEAQRSAGGPPAEGTRAPLVAGDERCVGRAAHAAAQRRLDALLAASGGLTSARQLTRSFCALTHHVSGLLSSPAGPEMWVRIRARASTIQLCPCITRARTGPDEPSSQHRPMPCTPYLL